MLVQKQFNIHQLLLLFFSCTFAPKGQERSVFDIKYGKLTPMQKDPKFIKLKANPFPQFDKMQDIMQEKRATGAYTGPHHRHNDDVSYPSSGSPSPVHPGQTYTMPSGRRVVNRSGPKKLLECANLSQRKRRYERRKEEDGSNDDEDEDDKDSAQKRKKSKRGWQKKRNVPDGEDSSEFIISRLEAMLREVVPQKGSQYYKEGPLRVIADWICSRDNFDEELKRNIVKKCMADGECREQAMYVATGCDNPMLEGIILEEMRKW